MPDVLRDHIHLCEDCRLFIQQWNAIELGLQSLKKQTPSISRDLRVAIHSRIQFERALSSHLQWKRWQIALAGLSAAGLLLACLYHILCTAGVMTHLRSAGPSLAATPPPPPSHAPRPQGSPAQISPPLPFPNSP
jgi:predicted anti-sigma-YlaC factor YlaD